MAFEIKKTNQNFAESKVISIFAAYMESPDLQAGARMMIYIEKPVS